MSSSYATCAAVGGSGPYNAFLIGGYLNYWVSNGVPQSVPLENSTSTSSPGSAVSVLMGFGELRGASCGAGDGDRDSGDALERERE